VAADPSSAVFLLKCSVAQQGIVTASKIASKKPTFSTDSFLSGQAVFQHSAAQSKELLRALSQGFLGKQNLGPIQFRWDHPGTKTPGFVTLFSRISGVRTTESSRILERAMGIEPTSEAWEASILPLYDARSLLNLTKVRNTRKGCVLRALRSSAHIQAQRFRHAGDYRVTEKAVCSGSIRPGDR
jgi:hypothetical protein